MTEPTEDQIEDWYYGCPDPTRSDTVDWLARKAYAAGAASRDAEIADAQDSADKRVAVAIGQRERMKDELSDAQAQAKTLATANADNARELQERIESLQSNLSDAMQELYKVRAEATTIIQSLESQLAALRAQESGGGPYPEGHANYYMRTRVAGTLSIGHAVYDAPITQEPVNQVLLDALGNLLAQIDMQVGNGFVPYQIEDAYAEYNAAIAAAEGVRE